MILLLVIILNLSSFSTLFISILYMKLLFGQWHWMFVTFEDKIDKIDKSIKELCFGV